MANHDLTDEEWAVVIDLLENEARQLPTEIHHASMADMKARLRQRREMVDGLLARLRPAVGQSPADR